eukprot:RCo037310
METGGRSSRALDSPSVLKRQLRPGLSALGALHDTSRWGGSSGLRAPQSAIEDIGEVLDSFSAWNFRHQNLMRTDTVKSSITLIRHLFRFMALSMHNVMIRVSFLKRSVIRLQHWWRRKRACLVLRLMRIFTYWVAEEQKWFEYCRQTELEATQAALAARKKSVSPTPTIVPALAANTSFALPLARRPSLGAASPAPDVGGKLQRMPSLRGRGGISPRPTESIPMIPTLGDSRKKSPMALTSDEDSPETAPAKSPRPHPTAPTVPPPPAESGAISARRKSVVFRLEHSPPGFASPRPEPSSRRSSIISRTVSAPAVIPEGSGGAGSAQSPWVIRPPGHVSLEEWGGLGDSTEEGTDLEERTGSYNAVLPQGPSTAIARVRSGVQFMSKLQSFVLPSEVGELAGDPNVASYSTDIKLRVIVAMYLVAKRKFHAEILKWRPANALHIASQEAAFAASLLSKGQRAHKLDRLRRKLRTSMTRCESPDISPVDLDEIAAGTPVPLPMPSLSLSVATVTFRGLCGHAAEVLAADRQPQLSEDPAVLPHTLRDEPARKLCVTMMQIIKPSPRLLACMKLMDLMNVARSRQRLAKRRLSLAPRSLSGGAFIAALSDEPGSPVLQVHSPGREDPLPPNSPPAFPPPPSAR